jgi:proteasome accessory factor B
VSRKIERLINLTIALLATKRYLTKGEIFRSVDGYEGNPETMERMFERDKDDLRNLGVVIEVGSFDPVFQDEAGYRIKPEGYSLNLGEISGVEIALLSLAAEAWRGAALDDAAHSALTKLQSMGVQSDLDALPAISPRLNPTHSDFQVIALAISKREVISFSYLSSDMVAQIRTLEPYAIATRNSLWYLAGRDIEKGEIRTFRLDRIDGEISINHNGQGFDIPAGFDVFGSLVSDEHINIATVDIRKGKAHLLRTIADSCIDKGEWEQIVVRYFDYQQFVDLILWHGDDVLVVEPVELRNHIIAALEEIVRLHA